MGQITENRVIDRRIRVLRERLRQLFDSGHQLQDESILEISRRIDRLVVARMNGAEDSQDATGRI